MGKLFVVERREDEGDYAIRRPAAERISGHEPTQAEAIERAREIDPNATVQVERVRNTSVGRRDKWRRPRADCGRARLQPWRNDNKA